MDTPTTARGSQTIEIVKSVRYSKFRTSLDGSNAADDLDYFDILPKTDYTYARSGSYSPRYLHDKYVMPNMSRHSLRQSVTPPVSFLQDSSSHTSREIENQSSERIVTPPTKHQRIGVYRERQLAKHQVDEFDKVSISDQDKQAMDSSPYARVLRGRESASHLDHESSQFTSTTNRSRSLVVKDGGVQSEHHPDLNHSSYNRRFGGRSESWQRSEATSRLERRGTDDDQGWISGRHQQQDGSLRRRYHEVKEEQFFDGEGRVIEREGVITRFFVFMMTVINTVVVTPIGYAWSATKEVTTLLWTYPLSPVGRLISFITETVTTVVESFILFDIWLLSRSMRICCICLPLLLLPFLCGGGYYLYHADRTAWTVPQGKGEVLQENAIARLEMVEKLVLELHDKIQVQNAEERQWLTRPEIEALLKSQLKSLEESLLIIINEGNENNQNALKAIFQKDARVHWELLEKQVTELQEKAQAQKEEERLWLHQSEIEVLIKTLLTPQLETLRLSLLSVIEDGNKNAQNAQEASQEDTGVHWELLEKELADLRGKAKDAISRLDAFETRLAGILGVSQGVGEGDLVDLREQMMLAISEARDSLEEKWGARLGKMELTIADLKTLIQKFQTSETDIAALSQKCCWDKAELLAFIQGEINKRKEATDLGASGIVSAEDIKGIIDAALVRYSADKIVLPDYALESNGGSVVNIRCSKTYMKRAATVKLWGIPVYYTVNGPRTVIQPEVLPGNCWPFEGQEGTLVIQLAMPIKPTMFTLEHITKEQSIFGDNKSAPKDFTVLGLRSESDTEGVVLGEYQYDAEGMSMQHFNVQIEDPGIFDFIELRVTSNHGNEEYTCLYRFRVHGSPS